MVRNCDLKPIIPLDGAINSCEITFSNNAKYKVSHILACDGIRSKVRDMYFPASGKPLYSGYSAWRGIGISESKTIQYVFKLLQPIFTSRNHVKYFLTVIGDLLHSKTNLN